IDATRWNSGTITDTIILDTTVPQGTFTINNNATYTTTASVKLTQFEYNDNMAGIDQIQFRNAVDANWSEWQSVVQGIQMDWTLSALEAGGETRTVFMHVRDKAGNIGTYSDTILYDLTAPTGQVTIHGQDDAETYATSTQVKLVIGKLPTDAYQIRFSNNNLAWGTWAAATAGTYSWNLNNGLIETEQLIDGTRGVWLEVSDTSGKTAVYSDSIMLDRTAPTGAVTINNGDIYVNTTTVSV
ncbi:MAG: hypothetical protein QME49_10075, partial [bacterium]|nr:hypothetical protein [bacterium]